jgi:hypothetical protein
VKAFEKLRNFGDTDEAASRSTGYIGTTATMSGEDFSGTGSIVKLRSSLVSREARMYNPSEQEHRTAPEYIDTPPHSTDHSSYRLGSVSHLSRPRVLALLPSPEEAKTSHSHRPSIHRTSRIPESALLNPTKHELVHLRRHTAANLAQDLARSLAH